MRNKAGFQDELSKLLNSFGVDNEFDTPDFILSEYMVNSLMNFRDMNRRKVLHNIVNNATTSLNYE